MKKFFAILFSVISLFPSLLAQQPLSGQQREETLARILSGYGDWSTVSLSGKIQIPNLPMGIKPSVKIWMKRGEEIQISLRAPLMGEVGRAEVTSDSILLANKMKNIYCKQALSDVLGRVDASLEDLQALLLARVALLGEGQLTQENAAAASLMNAADGSFMLVPLQEFQPQDAEYGYLVRPDGRVQALLVNITGKAAPISVIYDYTISGGWELIATLPGGSLKEITLSLDRPSWDGKAIGSFRPDSKWKRVSFAQFFRSF